jgi:hypothetical protein
MRLRLAQPALSRHVSDLEEEPCVDLLNAFHTAQRRRDGREFGCSLALLDPSMAEKLQKSHFFVSRKQNFFRDSGRIAPVL